MAELKSLTYEQARAEHFRALMKKEQRKIDWWQARENKLRPLDMASISHIECSGAGARYNYYNDALEALEKQSKWISVEERLPRGANGIDFCVLVLVYTQEQCITAGWNNDGTWHLINWDNDFITEHSADFVTHWMPLPEPPKEIV